MISQGPDINMGYYHDLFVYNVLYHPRYKITLVITVISFSLATLPPSLPPSMSKASIRSSRLQTTLLWLTQKISVDQVEEMESEIFKASSSIGCWSLWVLVYSGVVIISS